MSNCRSCGAPIIWAKTESGKSMPVDAEPVLYGGNLMFNADGTLYILPKGEPRPPDGKVYRSHFATCKNARQHRKSK